MCLALHRDSFCRNAFRSLLLFSLGVPAVWAQTTTGALSGTVTDPAGAVVVNAKVEVINRGTGVSSP